MEENITNNYNLKFDLRLVEIIGIWREKIICPKHDETLGALIYFEVVNIIKFYSTY